MYRHFSLPQSEIVWVFYLASECYWRRTCVSRRFCQLCESNLPACYRYFRYPGVLKMALQSWMF